jgi:hypothetical protein
MRISNLHIMKVLCTQWLMGMPSIGGYFQERSSPCVDVMPPLWLTRLLWQESLSVHHCPSTCASAALAWGSQKVMSMVR